MMKSRFDIFIFIISLFIPLIFISDGLAKYFLVHGVDFGRVTLFVRLIFEIIIVFYLRFRINLTNLKIFLLILTLLGMTLLGQMLIGSNHNIIENLITFNKYIFIFIIFIFFKRLLGYSEKKKKFVFTILNVLFATNILFIFLGFIFEIEFFKTFYHKDYRFGYDGIFKAGNEASYVMISMLAYLYYKAFYEKGNKYLLVFALLASLLSGLKAVYAFIGILAIYHVAKKLKMIYLLLLVPIVIFSYGYLLEYIMSEQFQHLISFFQHTYEEHGLIYMVLSGRNEILAHESLEVMSHWTWLNYLIGGVDTSTYWMEMDFFDLILFFGIFGTLIYGYVFYTLFIRYPYVDGYPYFFIFSILSLAFFGGHFLTSPTAALYFTLTLIYLQNKKLEKNEKNIINK